MRATQFFFTGLVVLLIANDWTGSTLQAQYSRRTPIVQAIEKTKNSIVSINTPPSRYGSQKSAGTGVIIDERGYIVTNRHVVGSNNQVTVRLWDGTELKAWVQFADADADLAILRVQHKEKLQALTLAPTSDLMQGETVLALGHPYGYERSVSVGIISALERQITMPTGETLRGLIQTNAAINPGNSGGPLLNINGELIGIVVALREGAQGIAFAINAATVRDLLTTKLSALNLSGVGHGMLCRERVISETGERQQVVVFSVFQATPAADAGLQKGDIIKTVGNCNVKNRFDVERAIWGYEAGEKVSVRILRDSQEVDVELVLQDRQTLARAMGNQQNPDATLVSAENNRGYPASNVQR